ncbi:MBL fold metallo-hydrolase [Treponema zuelzerae]|uniref:MBL fold metallo-hydrolase n=1 Tax=Teretinema zuelzerae TaxID=156 RepID=A0AAE3EHA9_9SPIR|nr:MBL fold metallo-hydrolase [Teretinema zuelzerae]MCD1653509.1 MBL fold metallo-hydrolase [Teretinema zuelzerae]
MVKYHVLTLVKDLGHTKSVINPILFETGIGLVLFDAGYPNQIKDFESEFSRLGFSIKDLAVIVISHHDHDHIGSLNDLISINKNIQIWANEIEASYICGKNKSLRLLQAEEYNKTLNDNEKIFGEQFVAYLKTIDTVPVDKVINDNESICTGLKVINTFGHTPGHISLYLEEEKILFVGDALAIEDNKLIIANRQFTLDMNETVKSIMKIININVSKVICYHGNQFIGNVTNSLNELLKNLPNN